MAMKIELTVEQKVLFESMGSKVTISSTKTYYHLPFWIELDQVTGDTYLHTFERLPTELKDFIKEERDASPPNILKVVLANGDQMIFKEGFEYEMKETFGDGTVKTQEDYDNAKWIKCTYTEDARPYIERMLQGKNMSNGLIGLRNIKKKRNG